MWPEELAKLYPTFALSCYLFSLLSVTMGLLFHVYEWYNAPRPNAKYKTKNSLEQWSYLGASLDVLFWICQLIWPVWLHHQSALSAAFQEFFLRVWLTGRHLSDLSGWSECFFFREFPPKRHPHDMSIGKPMSKSHKTRSSGRLSWGALWMWKLNIWPIWQQAKWFKLWWESRGWLRCSLDMKFKSRICVSTRYLASLVESGVQWLTGGASSGVE